MELFLFRHSSDFERLYNCTGVLERELELYPLEKRQFPVAAWTTIVLCTIYYVLYIPCMFSIWKHRENPCYKLLFYIGITDLLVLWIIGWLHGFLSLTGSFFCNYPSLIYITGVFGVSIWMAESTADLALAINRCVDVISPNLAQQLFAGYRAWIWTAGSTVYCILWTLFTKPVIFIPMYFSWFFNPYTGFLEDNNGIYKNNVHSAHNAFIAVSNPLTYIVFLIVFAVKTRNFRMASSMSNAQKMIFLQVLIISCLNTTASSIYSYMQYVSAPGFLIVIAQFAWFHIHGFPPVIYLLLNKTIRQDCQMFLLKVFCPRRVAKVHGVTVLAPTALNTTAFPPAVSSALIPDTTPATVG